MPLHPVYLVELLPGQVLLVLHDPQRHFIHSKITHIPLVYDLDDLLESGPVEGVGRQNMAH